MDRPEPPDPVGLDPHRDSALAETLEPHDLEAAPQVPAEAREELLALKAGAMFVCTRLDGDITPARASGAGLYANDTRHLSELRLTLGGLRPVPLSSAMDSGHHAVINATNPTLHARAGEVPQETLNVRRTILVGERLHYDVRVRSFRPHPVSTSVEIILGADFADVFDVRGVGRRADGRVETPQREGHDKLCFAYVGADGHGRETLVEMDPPPASVRISDQRVRLAWELELPPGGATTLVLTIDTSGGSNGRPQSATLHDDGVRLAAAHAGWEDACTRIESDNELFDRFAQASLRDLHALMMPAPGGTLPAAGIPWYVAPFGRDSLITASETLMLNPEVALGTLRVLATLQARDDEPWRDAEPGKILHELRTGELARTGQIPHTPYYGTVDATPLFLMLAGDYFSWTGDLRTMAELQPAIDAGLEWIDKWGDRDGDGFVEYECRAPAGLRNQGWKDSEDSIVYADGTLAEGPIALVEVQGYVYAAKLGIAEVYAALGDAERAARLRTEAQALRAAFNDAFWNPEEGFFALALDGRKRQVRSVSSNPGHCLYCGIVDDDKAAQVADRLMAADMFSGWGIRTLSSRSAAYNPMSYHNGSVWPHDNAIAAAGLKRYGFAWATERIAGALFDVAAGARDFRLPELFCGFDREDSPSVVAYPVACIPQAWAAGAPYLLLQALLGISAHAPARDLLVDRPTLPDWLGSLQLSGIRVGDARASLLFHRTDGASPGFSLLDQDGDVRVTMSA